MSRYLLITPVHNEELLLPKAIASIGSQTKRPVRWIIANDASTDNTVEVVKQYQKEFDFIHLIDVQRPPGRSFGNKARAVNQAYAQAKDLDFDFFGNLDGDISVEADYFDRLLAKFTAEPRLGIAGGMVFTNVGGAFLSQKVALDSVAGAVQLFRRPCWESLGGYMELPRGGIDSAAEIMARMKGWKVKTVPELRAFEHRRTGTADARPLRSRFVEGRRHYTLGYGMLFFLLRSIYRSLERPVFFGSLAAVFGFFAGVLRREPLALPPDVVHFLRTEQRRKLLGLTRPSN